MKYILSIDQSTQGTKGMLFDADGRLTARSDLLHDQLVDENGWVEHDPLEILDNTLAVCRAVLRKAQINSADVVAVGISNQRETVMAWDSATGRPLHNAIVWQCPRAADICEGLADAAGEVKQRTGLPLSPYFSAPKLTWLMQNIETIPWESLCCGTIDSWLIWNLTKEHAFKTDYSNASRTGLFNIHELRWDPWLCDLYQVPERSLPQVCMSDSVFGMTDLGGCLKKPVPLCGVLGDSQAAMFGHGCHQRGQVKTTYGTGSSIMMQIGDTYSASSHGLVTSLAWGWQNRVDYVLEGNLNYTGAVITWLKDDVGLIRSASETEAIARAANPQDKTYLVPAFSGLGAPYWDSQARALLCGMNRGTGRKEIVRAALDCIAYQITDVLEAMTSDCGSALQRLYVDGGPTRNGYLMQMQSDLARVEIAVPAAEELSGMGAAYMAGLSCSLYDMDIFGKLPYTHYHPQMEEAERAARYAGWKEAVKKGMGTPTR